MPTNLSTTITATAKKCKPFLLRVMVFSPEAGFKFAIEIQKACTDKNDEVWKLLFDLSKRVNGQFEDVVSVEFVAGNPNEITKIAAITDEGMKVAQVRAFRDNVYPLVKPFSDTTNKPTADEKKKIDDAMRNAISAA